MVLTSLAAVALAVTGWFYPGVAITLGIVFLVEAYDLRSRARDTEDLSVIKPMRLFHFSNAYLALLFVAAAVDPFLTLIAHRSGSRTTARTASSSATSWSTTRRTSCR